ncbi:MULTISPECIES: M56 family metallopeptidase [Butyricimonas]|uniref:M56 family metallopeptidase n=1 Tax=Butyricimonas TaxID=574697 RepID=UPI0007FB5A67|nr:MULTISPECIES: M56 family metallopeptidase [Butyricimonas]
MGTFFVYILKASFCLTVFYLFYRLLLSKETFHRFNRIALSGILVLSLLIPLCEITVHNNTEIQQTLVNLEQFILQADYVIQASPSIAESSIPVWILVALLVYFIGILFFFGRTVYSLVQMLRLVRSGRKEKLEKGITLVIHDKEIAPFSWMKYIVISEKDLTENSKEILTHEIAHIRNRHSIDLLVTDLCICFQWFNPASWLLKQELQTIHEYETDESVIRQGVNAKQYQLLLIKKAVGTRLYSMANSFNHSKLKKRITMMLKEKSSPWARAKYLYVLPLAVVTLTTFARPEISNELNEISAIKVNDFTSILETKAANNLAPEQDSLTRKNSSTKTVVRGDSAYFYTYTLEDSLVSITIASDTFSHKKGNITPRHTFVKDTIINGTKSSVVITTSSDSPLFILNGKEVSQETIQNLKSENIQSITVLKDQAAISAYGAKGVHGVVVVEPVESVTATTSVQIVSDTIIILEDGTKVKLSQREGQPSEVFVVRDGISRKVELQGEAYFEARETHDHPHFTLRTSQVNVIADSQLRVGETHILPGITSSSVVKAMGTVLDQDGNPIAGASVATPGAKTNTDKNGKFLLITGKNDKLTITSPGMKKVKLKTSPTITVYMEKE